MIRLFLLLSFGWCCCIAADRDSLPSTRPAHVEAGQFPIMAWGDTPSDPALLRDMREAGFNISGFCPPSVIKSVAEAGLVCFVDDARANGYRWTELPSEAEIRANLRSLAGDISGQNAAFGILLKDEPVVRQMEGLSTVARLMREVFPGKLPYINLFPYELSPTVLGGDYESYVQMLAGRVGLPYLSYDNYGLVDGAMLDYFFTNLEIVRRVAQRSKLPFWNCILAVAHNNYMEPSDATLHLQVYSTLAYGGRGIQYFRYFTRGLGDYRAGAIDPFGDRTPTWGMLRRVNNELSALIPTILRLRSTGVFHNAPVPDEGRPVSESRLVSEVQTNLDVEGKGYLISREALYRKFGNPGRRSICSANSRMNAAARF